MVIQQVVASQVPVPAIVDAGVCHAADLVSVPGGSTHAARCSLEQGPAAGVSLALSAVSGRVSRLSVVAGDPAPSQAFTVALVTPSGAQLQASCDAAGELDPLGLLESGSLPWAGDLVVVIGDMGGQGKRVMVEVVVDGVVVPLTAA